MKNYEYPGAIHIHTTFSDGTASVEKVIKAAQKAGLKWIIITDHNSLEALEKGYEGFHDNLCVLVGSEISPKKSNHYLAFDIKKNISENLTPEEYICKVNEQGGFGFIAHPDETEERKSKYPALRWENWDVQGFQGIEIWNYMSDWVDTLSPENKFKKILNPQKTLTGPTQKVLKWWDTLNSTNCKIVPAIVGLDVHEFHYNYMGLKLKVFPYEKMFKTLKNYIQIDGVLSRDFQTAKMQIYGALKSGSNIMINEALGHNENIVFTAMKVEDNNKFIKASVGEILMFDRDFTIDIQTPRVCNVKLYKDGQLVKEELTDRIKYKSTEPGSYRFEAFVNNAYWVLTNPIKVVKDA
jgi:hypothetical protein